MYLPSSFVRHPGANSGSGALPEQAVRVSFDSLERPLGTFVVEQ
jgi:hypothetical protein